MQYTLQNIPPMISTDTVFLLPGVNFAGAFFKQWLVFMSYLQDTRQKFYVSIEGTSNVSLVRDMCLGVQSDHENILQFAVPFGGRIEYKRLMWIDSDVVFTPEDFEKLRRHIDGGLDFVSGLYKKNPTSFAHTALNEVNVKQEQLYSLNELDVQGTQLIPASGVGLGFVMMRQGMLEKIPRPWFNTCDWTFPSGKRMMVSEDIYFCLKARECGFKLWIDPTVRCGHMKTTVWR